MVSELFVGFWSFSSNAEAPGGDLASKYGQGTLLKRELGSKLGRHRTGGQKSISQRLLFPSCLCMCLIFCIDMRSLYFPHYSSLYYIKAFSTNSSFSKSFFRTHRNAFRNMKPRNWNSLQHTAKESSHTENTVKPAPKLKENTFVRGKHLSSAALQSLSQGSCPVSSLRAVTL